MQAEHFERFDISPLDFVKDYISSNNLTFLAEGECFSVYLSSDNSSIIKIQKINSNFEKSKEVFYWTDFCIDNQTSPFIPKFKKVNIFHFKMKSVYIIESEKLIEPSKDVSDELKYIFAPFVSKDIRDISIDDIVGIADKVENNLILKPYINCDFKPFFNYLISYIQKISRKHGDTSFNFDFHYKNIMLNEKTNNIVIVDCFNCSSYDIE